MPEYLSLSDCSKCCEHIFWLLDVLNLNIDLHVVGLVGSSCKLQSVRQSVRQPVRQAEAESRELRNQELKV